MDSHRFFQYYATGAGLSYSSSYPSLQSVTTGLLGSSKSELRSSPNSPFSYPFDTETLTTLSDSQEQHNSTENLSGASPSSNSSLDYNNSFHLSSQVVSHQENLVLYSGGVSLLHNSSRGQNIKHALQELETALMGDDEQEVTMPNPSLGENKRTQQLGKRQGFWSQEACVIQSQPCYVPAGGVSGDRASGEKSHQLMREASLPGIPPGDLKQLLVSCARALSEKKLDDFDKLIERARGVVSVTGEPIQRLGGYMLEGLVARKEASGTNICRGLGCKEPLGKDLFSYMHLLYEICPYLKFGYMAANGAIADACKNEDRIHIIDFQIVQGIQWVTLLQALAARPSGPPYVRITGIDDPVSKYARGDSLEAVGRQLAAISEKFNIPVEFNAVPVFASAVTRDMLDIRPGEALAVNFPLQLHHTPDESVDVNNPRDGLLRMVKSLSPKVTTLVEQESNTNTAPFFPRFVEALKYYSAIFESIDVALPRDRKERINVEQHCLARDIVNIIACEDKERVERHELFGKWKSRLTMAGFQQYPLSPYVNSVIKGLLRCYSKHYTLEVKDGAMLLGWKERNLISASAWQ